MINKETRSRGSWRIPSVTRIFAALRPTYVAALLIGSLLAAVPDAARSIPASQSSKLEFRIRAEEGLEGIARSIVTDAGAAAEFPGIGSPEAWISDTV